jgi:D-inositol-3-phosphate glycosyltransferase
MMRVALVSLPASPLARLGGVDAGGQNVHVASLAKALAALGCQVTIHTRRTAREDRRHVAMGPGIVVHHIDAGPPRDLAQREAARHIDEFSAGLEEAWKSQRPSVVHAHSWSSGTAALPPARSLGLPFVQTFHTLGAAERRYEASGANFEERDRSEAMLATQADHIVSTLDNELADLVALGAVASAITLIPSGVDERFTTWGPQAPRQPGVPRVVYVGRLASRKGTDDLVQALAFHPTAELVVGGGLPLDEIDNDADVQRLRALALELQLTDRLHFVGGLERDEAAALIRSGDVVVCAPWFDGSGVVALEAMACGVPVIGTEVSGLVDKIINGNTGVLVPPRRPDLLGPSLQQLLDDPARREKLGRAGTRRSRQFRWEHLAGDTLSVYEQLVDRRGEPRQAAVSA